MRREESPNWQRPPSGLIGAAGSDIRSQYSPPAAMSRCERPTSKTLPSAGYQFALLERIGHSIALRKVTAVNITLATTVHSNPCDFFPLFRCSFWHASHCIHSYRICATRFGTAARKCGTTRVIWVSRRLARTPCFRETDSRSWIPRKAHVGRQAYLL